MTKRIRDYAYKSVAKNSDYLYRIYIYDCESLDKDVACPISKRQIKLKQTDTFEFRKTLLDNLKQQPYCAVRLGSFDSNSVE